MLMNPTGKLFTYCILLSMFVVSQGGCGQLTRMLTKSRTRFTIQVGTDRPDKNAVVERAVSVIENRISAIGLTGDVHRDNTAPDRIIVDLYGEQDLQRTSDFLFSTHKLELRKVISPPSPAPVQVFPTAAAAEQVLTGEQDVRPYIARDNGKPPQYVIVERSVVVSGEDIRTADAVSDTGAEYRIDFILTPDGARRMGAWSESNIGNYIAVVLDDEIQSIAFIKSQILDNGEITGRFTKASAEDIALSLKSGYLPATLKVIEEKQF